MRRAVGGLLLPLGALVYAALPPAWDFATSGLECGLGLFWIASCWALLCRRVAEPGLRRSTTLAVVIGIGPLIRPDFSIFTIAFVIALILLDHRHRVRDVARILIAMAVLPLVVELARMAYYGEIVPNTAIAKEASLANWSQGWSYFIDFAGGYLLLLPVCGLLGMAALRWRNATGVGPRRFRILVIAAVVGGAVHAVYIVRVGGDFMHARMLLPTLFLLLCPVAAVEVRRTTAARFGVAALVAWAIAAALWLGPPYSAAHSGSVFDPSTGIADERLYWLRSAHAAHPVTIDDYLAHQPYARAGAATRRAAARGARGLVVDALRDPRPSVALARRVRGPVVASAPALGLYGYAAGIDVTVVDDHGLASVLAARQRLEHRGRPGHEKALPIVWFVALYANPAAPLPEGVSARDVSAARRALGCGTLRDVVGRSTRPLDPPQALDDLIAAVRDNGFRFSSNPGAAAREECGT